MMIKQFRVFLTPEDYERIERLKAALEISEVLSLTRVVLERCMTRYPDPESITKVFYRQCRSAEAELSAGPVAQGKPQSLRIGGRYLGWITTMAEPLGFEHRSRMFRSILIMFERGDI